MSKTTTFIALVGIALVYHLVFVRGCLNSVLTIHHPLTYLFLVLESLPLVSRVFSPTKAIHKILVGEIDHSVYSYRDKNKIIREMPYHPLKPEAVKQEIDILIK